MKHIIQSFKTIALALILALGVSYVSAWTAPDTLPPGGNTSAPLNTSSNSQYKAGALGVGGILHGYTNFFVDGNVGIGTTSPGAKLEVIGDIKIGNQNAICSNANKGSIRFDSISTKLEYCNGTNWRSVAAEAVWLVNGLHNTDQCTVAGGVMVSDSLGNKMCKFVSASCPVGWTQYNNWSKTTASSATYVNEWASVTEVDRVPINRNLDSYCSTTIATCSISGHLWSDKSVESRTCIGREARFNYRYQNQMDLGMLVYYCYGFDGIATDTSVVATRTEIGCY